MKNPWGDADSCSYCRTETLFFCHLPKHATTDGAPLSTLNCVILTETEGFSSLR